MVQALRASKLSVRGFRNLAALELAPGERFNVIAGDNGQGKSNLLEAIEYLGSLRSFRGAAAHDMIARGRSKPSSSALVRGRRACRASIACACRASAAREVAIDGKRPRSRTSYLCAIQTVLFHPGDLQLVAGAPELRRALLDRVLERFDPTYAATLAAYERALRSRNQLCCAPSRRIASAIAAYHELLASAGAVIGQARAQLVSQLGARVMEAFARDQRRAANGSACATSRA